MKKKIHVLYIDDNSMDRKLIRDSLEKEHGGFILTEAKSKSEFEKTIAKNIFDIVLTDFNIAGYEGLQVLETINKISPDTPVVVVTGTGSEQVAVKSMRQGAAEYVIKSPNHIKRLPQTIINVLEKKEAELALLKSQERFNLAMEASQDGLFDWNLVTNEIYYSPGWKKMLGYEEDELPNEFSAWEKLTRPEDVKRSWKMQQELINKKRNRFEIEFKMQHKNGHWVDILSRASAYFDNKGKAIRIVGTHVDITYLKKIEQEMQQLTHEMAERLKETQFLNKVLNFTTEKNQNTDQTLKKIINELPDAWQYPDITCARIAINEKEYKTKKFSKSKWKIESAIKIFDKGVGNVEVYYTKKMPESDFGPFLNEEIELLNNLSKHIANYIERKQRDQEVAIKKIELENQIKKSEEQRIATLSILSDLNQTTKVLKEEINQRKRSQSELKKQEMLWRTLVQTIPDMIWLKDTRGEYITCNPRFEMFFGASEAEIKGKTDHDFVEKNLADFFRQKDLEAMRAGKPSMNEEEVTYASDGHKEILETIKTPMYGDNKKVIGVLGIARDITQRKKAEAEILKLSTAMEQSPVSIIITDLQGRIEYVNPKFCEISGYSKKEVLGKKPNILKSDEHPEKYYKKLWNTVSSGETWQGTFKNLKKNGEEFWEDAVIGPIKDSQGKIIHYIALKENVTEKKNLENQLQQAQKLEAIGQLASGVAHDFNNLLTIINGYSSILLDELHQDAPNYKEISQIAAAGERASSLTQQLLAFSRKQVIQPDLLDLNQLIDQTKKMLIRLIGENIILETKLEENMGMVKADAGQINQIIMNLVVNAKDAMPDGGQITIETKKEVLDESYGDKHFNITPGSYILLSVSDTGIGMDKKIQERIFDPFFTTKGIGKGTGLGLSTVYGIVKQSGGYIWVYSEPEQGTTFKIYFPSIIDKDADAGTKQKDSINTYFGKETILFVEDEDNVTFLAQNILESAGYNVHYAKNGKEALGIIKNSANSFDLILTDIVMPEMGGKQLLQEVKKIIPHIKVIFVSGYTDETITKSGILSKETLFLQKPFSPIGLLKIIRKALDEN